MSFRCDACGACCRNLDSSPLYKELDRGDGVCKYLSGNVCSIYDSRPLLCRVDQAFEIYFKHSMTKKEYYKLNYASCQMLKAKEMVEKEHL